MEIVMNYVLSILMVVLLVADYYFTIKMKIKSLSAEMINEYEVNGVDGATKMAEVVDRLYGMVPAIFKKFITKKVIEKIVQGVFDKVEEYAKKQVEKK